MPKRLSPAELDAATGAGGPPRSEDFEDDVEWHAAQDAWLNNWKPDVKLPAPASKFRRTEWDKLTKQHARAMQAAEAQRSRSPPPPAPAPKKRGAPRVLSDEQREAAAERHKLAKRQHSRIRTIVHRNIREERQRAADVAYEERFAARLAAAPAQAPPRAPAPRRHGVCDMCQHVMIWQIPQRCVHCCIKTGERSTNAWYDSIQWGPFDEHGICMQMLHGHV